MLGRHRASPLLGPASSLSTPPGVFLERAGWRTRGREQDPGCPREPYARVRGLQSGPSAGSPSPHPTQPRLPPRGPPALTPGAGPGPETLLLLSTRGPQEAASPVGGGVGGGAMRGLGPDSKTPDRDTQRLPSSRHSPGGPVGPLGAPSAGSTLSPIGDRAAGACRQAGGEGAELGHSSVAWTETGVHQRGLGSSD